MLKKPIGRGLDGFLSGYREALKNGGTPTIVSNYSRKLETPPNRTALKIRKRPGVVRGSFKGRSKILPGSFEIVRGSFGNPVEVVRRSFRIHSKMFQIRFRKFWEKFKNFRKISKSTFL